MLCCVVLTDRYRNLGAWLPTYEWDTEDGTSGSSTSPAGTVMYVYITFVVMCCSLHLRAGCGVECGGLTTLLCCVMMYDAGACVWGVGRYVLLSLVLGKFVHPFGGPVITVSYSYLSLVEAFSDHMNNVIQFPGLLLSMLSIMQRSFDAPGLDSNGTRRRSSSRGLGQPSHNPLALTTLNETTVQLFATLCARSTAFRAVWLGTKKGEKHFMLLRLVDLMYVVAPVRCLCVDHLRQPHTRSLPRFTIPRRCGRALPVYFNSPYVSRCPTGCCCVAVLRCIAPCVVSAATQAPVAPPYP